MLKPPNQPRDLFLIEITIQIKFIEIEGFIELENAINNSVFEAENRSW